ncbi:hypothetical protein PILCRDRAFT_716390 [Piloderma croceum F 1598]|uniref:Uncharacterized protein n=1 Tax=Piloderma croceum (strain F 1598) TaxID=765440 RepID=A0A0C3F188_PILCF|nr:hypothetical protein PILCRDRAFT_716390 [Piloderma croceum F 1598]
MKGDRSRARSGKMHVLHKRCTLLTRGPFMPRKCPHHHTRQDAIHTFASCTLCRCCVFINFLAYFSYIH